REREHGKDALEPRLRQAQRQTSYAGRADREGGWSHCLNASPERVIFARPPQRSFVRVTRIPSRDGYRAGAMKATASTRIQETRNNEKNRLDLRADLGRHPVSD